LSLDTINQRIVRKRKIKYVDAWGGKGRVITDFVMDLYRQWFEDSCGTVAITVINATEGGARIHSAQEMTLEEAAKSICAKKESPWDILGRIYKKKAVKNPEPFLRAARHAYDIISPLAAFSGKENSPEAENSAREALCDKDCAMIFSPFLKKTNAYLNRHPGLDEAKAFSLITKEIIRGSVILSQLLPECCEEIKKRTL
ncbi:MAG: hypothetical protein ACRCUT_02365, partial [Spirochaetota bacterium]